MFKPKNPCNLKYSNNQYPNHFSLISHIYTNTHIDPAGEMVTEADDLGKGTVALSSIALLQERFRQLEKMKELRQERELLKILSESEKSCSDPLIIKHQESRSRRTSCVRSELMFLPPNPHCQLSLSLWPDSQIKKIDSCRGIQAPTKIINAKSCFNDAPLVCSSDHVDTSLRL